MYYTASNRWWIVWCLLLAITLGNAAYDAHAKFEEKIRAQANVIDTVVEFKKTYLSLIPVNERWREEFPERPEQLDILGLYREVGVEHAGLNGFPDRVRLASQEWVRYGEQPLGLRRICLSTRMGEFEVSHTDVEKLLEGVGALLRGTHIESDSIRLSHRGSEPLIALRNFCMLMRGNS